MHWGRLTRPESRTINLDGEWSIVFDPENQGKARGWHTLAEPPTGAEKTIVPSCWEQIRPGYDGVAWYWRTLPSSRRAPGERVFLLFEAANYATEVWIDGRFLGFHEGGYTPFSFDATAMLNDERDHILTARVLCPPKDEVGIDGFILKETPCWRSWESFNFGGLWQSVHLVTTPRLYVDDCFVEPAADLASALVHVTFAGAHENPAINVEATLYDWKDRATPLLTKTESFHSMTAANRAVMRLPIDRPNLWSPESPHLYWLEVKARTAGSSAEDADVVGARFGMRRVDFAGNRFLLNRQPYFIKGGFHEGLYPVGLPKPPSREFVAEEIRKAKEAGFNLLRYWQIPIHPWVLDAADELGLMLMDEPPIEWITQTEQAVERCRREVEALVRRDRNRPSVVFWTLLNEAGICADFNRRNFGSFSEDEWKHAPIQRARHSLCRLARSLDPSRLIIDDSGGWVNGAAIYLPGSYRETPFNDIHIYLRAPTSDAALAGLRSLAERDGSRGRGKTFAGAGALVSEFGYGSFPELERIVEEYDRRGARRDLEDAAHHRTLLESLKTGFERSGLSRRFADVNALCLATQDNHAEGNALQTLALRANPRVAGYVMHAFSAGGCILGAELFDTWRRPKKVAQAVAQAQRSQTLAMFFQQRCVYPGAPLNSQIIFISDVLAAVCAEAELTISIDGPGGFSNEIPARVTAGAAGLSTLWEGDIALGTDPGEYRLQAALRAGKTVVAQGERRAFVIAPRAFPSDRTVCALGVGWEQWENSLRALNVATTRNPAHATHVIADIRQQTQGVFAAGYRDLAARGARLVVLAGSAQAMAWAQEGFGLSGRISTAVGNWSPVCHYFEDEGLQSGLPAEVLLGQAYADVLPSLCWVTDEGRALAGCFSYIKGNIFTIQTEIWWGKTIIDKPVGAGRVVLCSFDLNADFHKAPMSRALLFNLLQCGC